MARTRRLLFAAILGIAGWCALVVAGFARLSKYELTAGDSESAPPVWPDGSAIERRRGFPTLALFAHPRCPCTSASLEELDRLLARVGREASTTILFVGPPGAPNGWERGRLWEAARRIPGVSVVVDAGGNEARCFRARTSGALVLYDPSGRLLFSGGITGARGHAGDNAGRDAVRAWLSGNGAELTRTPVFGCALDSPADSESDSANVPCEACEQSEQ